MRRSIKVVAMLLAVLFLTPITVTEDGVKLVHAETVQEKIDNASKEKREALDNMQSAEERKEDVVAESQELDREIDIVQTEIFEIDSIIADADAEIKEKEAEIAQYEDEILNNNDAFKEVLRSMDENSVGSYLELLLSATSFSELLAHVETINEITAHDTAVIDEMIRLKNGVETAKMVVENKKSEQEDARTLAVDKEDMLQTKLDEKEALTKELEQDIEKYRLVYEQARQDEENFKAELLAELSKTPDPAEETENNTETADNKGTTEEKKTDGSKDTSEKKDTAEKKDTSGSKTSASSNGKMCWPAPSYVRISSPYGYRIHPIFKTKKMHTGVDMAAPGGSNLLAAESGTVIRASWNGGYGNCLVIDHGKGISTLYGHCQKLLVSKGQKVTRGQVVALVGTTGNSTGNHLHFEVLVNGKHTNPMPYLQ